MMRWMIRTTYNHGIARTGFTLREAPWHFGDFCYILQPNVGEGQKKVLPSERGVPGIAPCSKYEPG